MCFAFSNCWVDSLVEFRAASRLCLFLMWKRILHHFSLSSVWSSSHAETAHQRGFMIDLIHSFKAWYGFYFAAVAKLFLILLQKWQILNWCIVSFSLFVRCFLISECLSVVIWSTVTPFVLKNLSPSINPTFSKLLEVLSLGLWS